MRKRGGRGKCENERVRKSEKEKAGKNSRMRKGGRKCEKERG